MSAKKTTLYETHVSLGAKIVDFGGWDMPLNYGSQIEEHHAVRKSVGMFDVSHMLNVDITGVQAEQFLRHLLANDVARIAGQAGKAFYSCMLRPDGGVIDDLIVYFFAEQSWRVVVNAGTADKDLAWMQSQAKDFEVTITPRRDLAMVAIQGPEARALVWQVRPQWQSATADLKPFNSVFVEDEILIARTGYTGEDGFEIVIPATLVTEFWNDLHQAGSQPCGLGARDTLRLEAGMNLYGQDMDESTNPIESGLAWTVYLKDQDRNFIGRQALAELSPKQELVGLKLLDRGIMRAHMKVHTAHGIGEITSGTMAPTVGCSIGLARIPKGSAVGDQVQVEIRGKQHLAQIVKAPFVRNGNILI